jgi:hypothetical protein
MFDARHKTIPLNFGPNAEIRADGRADAFKPQLKSAASQQAKASGCLTEVHHGDHC